MSNVKVHNAQRMSTDSLSPVCTSFAIIHPHVIRANFYIIWIVSVNE